MATMLSTAKVMDGSRFELAAKETTVLVTEVGKCTHAGPFERILDSFLFLSSGLPTPLNKQQFETQDWSGVSVVGAVASVVGKGNLFAQCGWFDRISWLWLHLSNITEIKLKCDSRFRAGVPCMWLKTPLGEYALLAPHRGFSQQWDASIARLDGDMLPPKFQRWPVNGSPPDWWSDQASDQWPTESLNAPSSKLKRPLEQNLILLANASEQAASKVSAADQVAAKRLRVSDPSREKSDKVEEKEREPKAAISSRATSLGQMGQWSLDGNVVSKDSKPWVDRA